jgi:DNA invertase Pin-like site-specific DNA recombinase
MSEDFTVYGYARVSAPGQDLDLQVAALNAAGCDKVFAEKASAAHGKARPQLSKALEALKPGDVFMVKSLTRVARSTRDALMILDAVVARAAVFRSMEEPWADMTTPAGEFMTTLMSAFSEFDRKMILQRTGEGRRFAKSRGVKLGPKFKLSAAQQRFVIAERSKVPPMSFDDLSALLKVSKSTLKRIVAKADQQDEALFTPRSLVVAGDHWQSPSGRIFGPGEQIDLEEMIHPPSCAIHTSGLGNTVRCTCGRAPSGPFFSIPLKGS